MGIIKQFGDIQNVGNAQFSDIRLTPEEAEKQGNARSDYNPSEEEKDMRAMILRHFVLGYQTMYKPRREFNDLPVINRMQVDQMSFNTYQPNNGDAPEGDIINGWKSRAVRPIVRNKCISMAAHATARLIFPKVFAHDTLNQEQKESAGVMRDLMEWSADQSNYTQTSMQATLTALWSPASIVYTEYCEVYKKVKTEKGTDGKWIIKDMINEDFSGFKDTMVPVDQLFIENIFENDIQKQGFLIMRNVISYSSALAKYGKLANFKYVKPGVLTVFSDANATFYEVYDTTMRQEEVEEVTYWNKSLDVKIVMLNGVLVTDYDEPNPRIDKNYPFIKFGYELIDEGKFFYYKSLAFKIQQDANIVNSLYPMIIDGTYLSVMQPMVNYGPETIGSDVLVPGAVTSLSDPNSKLTPVLNNMPNLQAGMTILNKMVEESVDESASSPVEQPNNQPGGSTAYEISRLEQNAATNLGMFIKMISQFVKDYGKLRGSDILQYLTIVDAVEIDGKLAYKSFLITPSKGETKHLKFDGTMSDESMSSDTYMKESYKILEEQGGPKADMFLYKINPRLFRDLKFKYTISPDVLEPRSEDLERAMKLELFDRAIQLGPAVDQEKIASDFLFGAFDFIKDPSVYIPKGTGQPMAAPSSTPASPLAMMAQGGGLPTAPSVGKMGGQMQVK